MRRERQVGMRRECEGERRERERETERERGRERGSLTSYLLFMVAGGYLHV